MCVFSANFFKKQPPWPTVVVDKQPPCAMAVARRLPAAVGILQPSCATAMGNGGRRGPLQLVVKTENF
jgi:hypothetical protein